MVKSWRFIMEKWASFSDVIAIRITRPDIVGVRQRAEM